MLRGYPFAELPGGGIGGGFGEPAGGTRGGTRGGGRGGGRGGRGATLGDGAEGEEGEDEDEDEDEDAMDADDDDEDDDRDSGLLQLEGELTPLMRAVVTLRLREKRLLRSALRMAKVRWCGRVSWPGGRYARCWVALSSFEINNFVG
jgi:hypothetical protein